MSKILSVVEGLCPLLPLNLYRPPRFVGGLPAVAFSPRRRGILCSRLNYRVRAIPSDANSRARVGRLKSIGCLGASVKPTLHPLC